MSALKEAIPSDDMLTVAGIGHNGAPEPTPFDHSEQEILDLYTEAKNWLDGEPVTTQAVADQVQKLMDNLRKAAKTADERRVTENKPYDEAKAAVQAKYAPLIADTKSMKGKTVLGIEACKEALKPFLLEQERQKRETAEAARQEANRQREAAEAAIRASREADLTQREEAERLLLEAKKSEATAIRAENDKAQAKGSGRAASLRTRSVAEVSDMTVFARFVWGEHRDIIEDWLTGFAQKKVDAGAVVIPGVTIREERTVV